MGARAGGAATGLGRTVTEVGPLGSRAADHAANCCRRAAFRLGVALVHSKGYTQEASVEPPELSNLFEAWLWLYCAGGGRVQNGSRGLFRGDPW